MDIPGFVSDRQYYILLRLNKIKKHPIFESLFPRSERDIEAIQEAIKRDGMLEPLIVVKHGDEYILLDGYTRYEALSRLKQETATAIVIENIDVTNNESIKLLKQLALSVNTVRRHLSPEQLMEAIEELNELRSAPSKEVKVNTDLVKDTYEKITREHYNTTVEVIDYIIAESKRYPGFFKAIQKAFNEVEKFPGSIKDAKMLLSFFSDDVKKSVTVNDADALAFIMSRFSLIRKDEKYRNMLRTAKTVEELRSAVSNISNHIETKTIERLRASRAKKEEKQENKTKNAKMESRTNEEGKETINVNITINQFPLDEKDKTKNLELIRKEHMRKFIDEVIEEAKQHEVYLHKDLLYAILPVVQNEAPDVVHNLIPLSNSKKEKIAMDR